MALVALSAPAMAEWTVIWVGSDIGLTVYVDLASITREGDTVKMWEMMDYKTVQQAGDNYLSSKAQRIYDCASQQFGLLAFSVYSRNMGAGDIVYSNDVPGKLRGVQPNSVGQALWRVACDSN